MNTCIYDTFARSVCVCVRLCVCLQDYLKTIAEICFLPGSYVGGRKCSDVFACQDHRSRSRSF